MRCRLDGGGEKENDAEGEGARKKSGRKDKPKQTVFLHFKRISIRAACVAWGEIKKRFLLKILNFILAFAFPFLSQDSHSPALLWLYGSFSCFAVSALIFDVHERCLLWSFLSSPPSGLGGISFDISFHFTPTSRVCGCLLYVAFGIFMFGVCAWELEAVELDFNVPLIPNFGNLRIQSFINKEWVYLV